MRSLTMPATQCDAKVIDELKTRLIRGVSCEVDLEEVSSIMPEDKDADTPFAVAQDYAAKLGFELACVSKEMQKGRAPFEPSCEEEEEDEFELVRRVRTRPTSSSPEPYPGVMMVCSS